MRGTVDSKLIDFLTAANQAIADDKANGVAFSPELTRQKLENLAGLMTAKPELPFIEDRILATDDLDIPVRVYSPAPTESLPLVIHFHGGGHVCGSVDLYDPICRQLADIAGVVVVSVEYRLAPETPYPGGLEDCHQVLMRYPALLGGVRYQGRPFIMGDSAGGAICTSLTHRRLAAPADILAGQILIYPSVDYRMQQPSVTENGRGFLLEMDKVRWYFEQYFQLPEGTMATPDAAVMSTILNASPIMGNFSQPLPATLVVSCGCDPLRDEAHAYVRKLAEQGADVQHHEFAGMVHAYMLLQSLVEDECRQTYEIIKDFIMQHS